jgi:predicted ATP-dependent endonuclease of OLD family
MILSRLQIINYKSCNNIYLELEKDIPNILIGINDSGKSSILNAMGLLLDDKLKFNFTQDDKVKKDLSNIVIKKDEFDSIFENLNVTPIEYSETKCYIVGEFILEENDINEDLSTHLQWVLDKKEVEKIWLARVFDNSDSSSIHLLLTPQGIDDRNEYYKEKATALSKIAKEKKVDQIKNENKAGRFSALEILRGVMNTLDLQPSWADYKLEKTDKGIFPQYRYLDWNISMDQLNQFTKDTMQQQIKADLQEARDFANEKRKLAQEKINQELDGFADKFLKDVPSIEKIKANIYFDVEPRITDIVINKKHSIGDIHIDSQGEGVKRQIWFSLIKWNALNSINLDHKNKKFIWCFDEPETHLYPTAQRDFYSVIKQTSSANVQSIISTHSTIFVDKTNLKSINKIDLIDGLTSHSKCTSIDDIYSSLKLKNSDFLFYDQFVVVEGDTEETLIPHFYEVINGSTLENDNIRIINLGGKDKIAQNALILNGILGEFKKSDSVVYFIMDSDAQYKLTEHEIEKYKPLFIGRQDIEDSINSSVWENIIIDNLEESIRLNKNEIEGIINGIRDDAEEESKKKFYPKMISSIKKKLRDLGRDDFEIVDTALPSKGTDSGKLIIKYIDNETLIDTELANTLKQIKANC